MQNFLNKNLALLDKKSPETCSLLKNLVSENQYNVSLSKSGVPTLFTIYPDGTKRTIHSKYDPLKEATQFIESCFATKNSNYILCGLGLGYHLNELINKTFEV